MSLGRASTDETFFAGEKFARSRRLRKRSTYLIMNLTVAYLGERAAAGPVDLWFFRTGTGKEHGQRHGYKVSMIADIFNVASPINLALISLERWHATLVLYPIEHFLVGQRIYYKILFLNWFMDLILTSILSVIRLNDAVAGRCTWIIYTLLTLVVLTTSYVTIISKVKRKPSVHQYGSVITAERRLSVTSFIVSAASTLTLLPWVIIICISMRLDHLWIQYSSHAGIWFLHFITLIGHSIQ